MVAGWCCRALTKAGLGPENSNMALRQTEKESQLGSNAAGQYLLPMLKLLDRGSTLDRALYCRVRQEVESAGSGTFQRRIRMAIRSWKRQPQSQSHGVWFADVHSTIQATRSSNDYFKNARHHQVDSIASMTMRAID